MNTKYFIIAALASLSLCACKTRRTPMPSFAIATQDEAKAFVQTFFDHYVRAEVDQAVDMLCEKDLDAKQRAGSFIASSQAANSSFRVASFRIEDVKAGWEQKAPLFLVDVSFPRSSSAGRILHTYRVRVVEGCLDQLLGPPPQHRPQRSPPNSAESPKPQPQEPSAPPNDVIEL